MLRPRPPAARPSLVGWKLQVTRRPGLFCDDGPRVAPGLVCPQGEPDRPGSTGLSGFGGDSNKTRQQNNEGVNKRRKEPKAATY